MKHWPRPCRKCADPEQVSAYGGLILGMAYRGKNVHISPAPIVNAGRIFKETPSVARSGLFSGVIICGTARQDLPRHENLTCSRSIERNSVCGIGRASISPDSYAVVIGSPRRLMTEPASRGPVTRSA